MTDYERALNTARHSGYFLDTRLKSFPIEVYQIENVRRLEISTSKFTAIPDGISALKGLAIVEIRSTPLVQLPADLGDCKILSVLKISKTQLTELPESLGKLSRLSLLYVHNNQLTSLPASLADCPYLTELDISENPFTVFPEVILHLPRLMSCKCRKIELFHENFRKPLINERFYTALRKSEAPREMRYALYRLLSGDVASCADIPLPQLLYAAQFPEAIVKLTAQQLLQQKAEENWAARPLQKGSRVLIMGRTPQKISEWKERLTPWGIEMESRLSDKTTHLVLGAGLTEGQLKTIETTDKCWLFPPFLERFLEQSDAYFLRPAAAERDEAQEAHLSSLLASQDPANAGLALELLAANGVPAALHTDLLLVVKASRFSLELRRQAKKLLLLNAPPALAEKVKQQRDWLGYRANMSNIRSGMEDAQLDWRKVVAYIEARASYAPDLEDWLDALPVTAAREYLQDRLRSKPDLLLHANRLRAARRKELLPVPGLRRISFPSARSLPPALFAQSDLRWLDLSNSTIRPEHIAQLANLTQLRELNLNSCKLEQFPEVLYALPHLQTLHLWNNPLDKKTIDRSRLVEVDERLGTWGRVS